MTFKNWLAGLVMGVGGGFLVLIFPAVGVLLLGLGAIGVLRARPRMTGTSGLLVGTGAMMLAVLIQAQMACQAFDAAPDQGCEAPDVTSYVVAAGGLLVAGLLGSVVAVRRRPSE